jgi:antitoxin component of RelBE/YafQ-DinJ toxin-antitoxin module
MKSKNLHHSITRGSKMETIKIKLDEQTLARALQIAESQQCSLEELIRGIIEQIKSNEYLNDPFMGMFANEPELVDQILESSMKDRESHTLRNENE